MLPKSRDKVAMAIVAAVLTAVIGVALYIFLPSSLVIDDVSRAQIYRISTKAEDDAIYAIKLSGGGEIPGTVTIQLLTTQEVVVDQWKLQNDGEFETQRDWYGSEALIRVVPGTAQSGELKLSYRFVGFF